MNTARYFISGGGSQTSTLAFGGTGPAVPGPTTKTESYDGTSWTEVNDLAIARYGAGGAGLDNTSSLCFFGDGSPTDTETEEWGFPPSTSTILQEGQLWFNSTSSALKGYGTAAGIPAATWSSGGSLNTGRENGIGFGLVNTAAVVSGGQSPITGATESYDGTSFTEVNNLNTARRAGTGAGSSTAGLVFGGQTPSLTGVTESWDGTNFTEQSDLNTARTQGANGKLGTQTDAMFTGGESPPTTGATEIWDGTSWTEVSDLNDARKTFGGAGSSTPTVIVFGGDTPPNTANTETWDGTSWTEVNNLNTARSNLGGSGTNTAALAAGGDAPGSSADTETWNGTNWTEVNNLNTARGYLAATKDSNTTALVFGGNSPSVPGETGKTEEWNGASWVEVADLSTARDNLAGSGTASAALAFGGVPPSPAGVVTEEWNVPSNVVKTLTD